MIRKTMAACSGLLSCCLLVALPLVAGVSAPQSPRDPAIVGGQWTWAGGSNRAAEGHLYGLYGTKGVGAPGNVPGARSGSASWTDASGSFWLFGGYGYAEATFGSLNDLWKWDGTSWTWVSGSKAADQDGVYGTIGVGAPGNVPGSRGGSVSWTDTSGNFWLFGGSRYFGNNFDIYSNELWKWDGTNWTWVSGSNEQDSIFGEKGVPAPGNTPGARTNAVSWIDASGNLWLFGGEMFDCGVWDCYGGYFNDLWRWDGANWAWMGGSQGWSEPGTYGTKGVAAPENVPGGRGRSVSWKDASGSFWLFGGVRHVRRGVGISQRPLEVGRNELDLGERIERGEPARNLRNEGRPGPGQRPGSKGAVGLVDGPGRQFLAVWGIRLQRPLEVGRDELDLD
ncbi:MAG: hypothetical protein IPP07_19395 [Holophagales bacterium]|nr:hypothetical protein [Holophagales bacterium]